jgi:hypothetical protein
MYSPKNDLISDPFFFDSFSFDITGAIHSNPLLPHSLSDSPSVSPSVSVPVSENSELI